MTSSRTIETAVGLFLIMAIGALLILAFKVSGLTTFFKSDGYQITATFDDIGQLKVRAPVKIGGVSVGEVTSIRLNAEDYKAIVAMSIYKQIKDIPNDSVASILTAGLLGDNYIAITPMYSEHFLSEGDMIQETHSAMILEKLIGQFLFKLGQSDAKSNQSASAKTTKQLGG